MRSRYLIHDDCYREVKARGATGWDAPKVLKEHKNELEFPLRARLFKPNSALLELGCGAGEISIWSADKRHR